MTVSEAREILGQKIEGLTDEDVEKLIASHSLFCDALIDVFESYLTLYKNYHHNGDKE